MGILTSALIAVAVIGLLLLKVNHVAKKAGAVWQKVETVELPPEKAAQVIPINRPVMASQTDAVPEKVLVAKHS
jgi:hypothetical protein